MKWKSKDEIKNAEEREERRRKHREAQARAKDKVLEKLAQDYLLSEDLPEEEKALFVALYELWEPEVSYDVGVKLSHENGVFEVLQAHTSQSDWEPQNVPALFKKVYQTTTSDGEEVIPDFKQPTGGHDAYSKGDKVHFEGKVFESTIDNNVWSPSGYPQGWKEIN